MARATPVVVTTVASPWGNLWLSTSDQGLCRVELSSSWQPDELAGGVGMESPVLRAAASQIAQYLSGRRREFDLPLDLSAGTPFQQAVWRETARLAFGETCSYRQLAQALGADGGQRAVGQALRRNPLLIVVPCHRVLRSDGGLGGFGAGLKVKRGLLALEGIRLQR